MSIIDALHRSEVRSSVLVVRTGIVGLALATAAIHASLGGMIFTLNAIGYTTLAMAMVLPGPFGRYRWLIRLALAGFTAATIGGWVLFGARFPLAYLDKALEIGLLVLVTFNFAMNLQQTGEEASKQAAGALWVAIMLAAMLGFNHVFGREKEQETLDGLLLCPVQV